IGGRSKNVSKGKRRGRDWSGTPAQQRLIFLPAGGGCRRKPTHRRAKYSRCKTGRTESPVQPPARNVTVYTAIRESTRRWK
ncbi:MAG: hypothetical protein ACOCX8_04375, partial [Bacteroidota bacterium]